MPLENGRSIPRAPRRLRAHVRYLVSDVEQVRKGKAFGGRRTPPHEWARCGLPARRRRSSIGLRRATGSRKSRPTAPSRLRGPAIAADGLSGAAGLRLSRRDPANLRRRPCDLFGRGQWTVPATPMPHSRESYVRFPPPAAPPPGAWQPPGTDRYGLAPALGPSTTDGEPSVAPDRRFPALESIENAANSGTRTSCYGFFIVPQ